MSATNLAGRPGGRKGDRRGSPKPYPMHDSLTVDRISEAVARHNESLDDPGFCVLCGVEVEGVESDAREYECEACGGEDTVYGAEELLMHVAA